MILRTHDIYDIFNGAILNRARFLWKNYGEQTEEYNSRLDRSVFNNWLKKGVEIYLGYVFSGRHTIETRPDFDILSLSKKIALHSILGGKCYVLVLRSGAAVYREDQVSISDDQTVISGEEDSIVISGGEVRNKVAEESEPFTPEQLIECCLTEDGKSMVYTAAEKTVDLYNLENTASVQLARSLTFYTTGGMVEKASDLKPYSHVPVDSQGNPLSIVQPAIRDNVETIRSEIRYRVMDIGRIMGLEAEFAEEIRFESGISKAYSMIDIEAIISLISTNVSLWASQAARVYRSIVGGPDCWISLDPTLAPATIQNRLMEFREFSDLVPVPAVKKALWVKATEMMFSDWPDNDRAQLISAIEGHDGNSDRFNINDF